ncbi:F-box and WD-40 domain-containing protein CDC4 [Kwoniella heveanensis CBS 569]|nr:F-box and WD-40 domain-containing protein CDC4 [Kwoniella heveanensis CBS 569]
MQPAPADMQFFSLNLGGKRVVIQDESSLPPFEGHLEVSGPGWKKNLVPIIAPQTRITTTTRAPSQTHTQMPATPQPEERIGFLNAVNRSKGKEVRKRPHNFSRPGSRAEEGKATKLDAPTPPVTAAEALAVRQRSPPRKKIRGLEELMIHQQAGNSSLLSPLPSPEQEAGPSTASGSPSPTAPTLGSGLEMATLLSLPALVNQFDNLPDRLQQHLFMHLLRRSRMPTIQRVSTFAAIALKRDFIALLPHEVAVQILRRVDRPGLAVASRVCKRWNRMINTERSVWQQRLIDDDLWYGHGVEEEEEEKILERYETLDWKAEMESRGQFRVDTPSDDERMLSATIPSRSNSSVIRPTPLKHIYRRRVQNQQLWLSGRPDHSSFPGHGTNVVTCLQFDEDKIISASDDHSINIYNTADGALRGRLDGHEGGVWTLQYRGDILVSGSTDRTVRIWDLEDLEEKHVFYGHTSTVRCLQIVEPVWDAETGTYQPPYPVIVTGSRDATLRVWRLPGKDDPPTRTETPLQLEDILPPEENPYHLHRLDGHTLAVRALATHGRICVSGSYDETVRVWDIVKGTCLHVLTGHEAKVYSIVYDRYRNRCASGSMDNTVKVWDVGTGECLHTLTGHTSLVGLLAISPNHLVSAAADSTLRLWDPETLQIRAALLSHTGAITCFQHDETKIVSGSDGSLKLWDAKTGAYVRDLMNGISSVWQLAFKGNLLVAASNRNNQTVFDIFNFDPSPSMTWDVDDDRLDALRAPAWDKGEHKLPIRTQSSSSTTDEWDMPNSPTPGVRAPAGSSPMDKWGGVRTSLPSNIDVRNFDHGAISPSLRANPGQSQGTRRSTRLAGRHSLPSQPVARDQQPFSGLDYEYSNNQLGVAGPSRRAPPPAFHNLSVGMAGYSPSHVASEPTSARLRYSRRSRNRDRTIDSPTASAGLAAPSGLGMGISIDHGVLTRRGARMSASTSGAGSSHAASSAAGRRGNAAGSSFVPTFDEGDVDLEAEPHVGSEGEEEEDGEAQEGGGGGGSGYLDIHDGDPRTYRNFDEIMIDEDEEEEA